MFLRSEMKHTLDKIIISLLREEPQTYYERRQEEEKEKEGEGNKVNVVGDDEDEQGEDAQDEDVSMGEDG